MNPQSLSRQLSRGLRKSPIDDKYFAPLDLIEKTINEKNVKVALGFKDGIWGSLARLGRSSELAHRVATQARITFAALMLMDKVAAIHGLLDEGLTDESLPLSRDPDHDAFLSYDKKKTFAFVGWNYVSVSDFIDHKQWLFLAPVLDTNGQLIEISEECALPFTESGEIGNGAAGVVLWAQLHPAHQRGFEVSDLTCESNLRDTEVFRPRRLISKSL